MTRRAWTKFWWEDYENDIELKLCSLEAQGLWMRLLCYMHRSAQRGYLVSQGKPLDLKHIEVLTGQPRAIIRPLLTELHRSGVCSVTPDGVTYSRRLVADTEISERASAAGKKGGGNPALMKQDPKRRRVGRPAGRPARMRVTPEITPLEASFGVRPEIIPEITLNSPAEVSQQYQSVAGEIPLQHSNVTFQKPAGGDTPVHIVRPKNGTNAICEQSQLLSGSTQLENPLEMGNGKKPSENELTLFSKLDQRIRPPYKPEAEAEAEAKKESKGTLASPMMSSSPPVRDMLPTASVHRLRMASDVQAALEAWQELAARCGLATVKALNGVRERNLTARLRDDGGLAGWMEALSITANTPFLLGENKTGWRASFDFLASRSGYQKIRENTYGRSQRQAQSGPADLHAWMASGVSPFFQRPDPGDAPEPPTIDSFFEEKLG